ncbi:hypothetical protein ACOSP7_017756 [Xanthoceras sorbifolium]
MTARFSVGTAEASVILLGITLASDIGLSPVSVGSDALSMVDSIVAKDSVLSEEVMQSFPVLDVQHVPCPPSLS